MSDRTQQRAFMIFLMIVSVDENKCEMSVGDPQYCTEPFPYIFTELAALLSMDGWMTTFVDVCGSMDTVMLRLLAMFLA